MQHVITQDWLNSFWIAIACFVLHFIARSVSSLMNVLERECLWLREISINVNKLFTVVCVFCLCPPCSIVVACLLVYPLFYTDAVAIFFFIRSLCKQVHCFVLRTFVYYFNNTISIFVTIHTWLIITIFRLGLQSSFLYHLCCVAEHKYIQNWPLQPFSQDYVLVSHATYVVCVNFICDWRDLTV